MGGAEEVEECPCSEEGEEKEKGERVCDEGNRDNKGKKSGVVDAEV